MILDSVHKLQKVPAFKNYYPKLDKFLNDWEANSKGICEAQLRKDLLSQAEYTKMVSFLLAELAPVDMYSFLNHLENRTAVKWEVWIDLIVKAVLFGLVTIDIDESSINSADNPTNANGAASKQKEWERALNAWKDKDDGSALDLWNNLMKSPSDKWAMRLTEDMLEKRAKNKNEFTLEYIKLLLNDWQKASIYISNILQMGAAKTEILCIQQEVEQTKHEVKASMDSLFARIIEICGIMIAIFAVVCTNIFVLAKQDLPVIQILVVNCSMILAISVLCGILALVAHPRDKISGHTIAIFVISLALVGLLLILCRITFSAPTGSLFIGADFLPIL